MNVIATAIEGKPFVIFQSWDGPLSGLVIPATDRPENLYGVCPLKITEANTLVNRTPEEMAIYQAEYTAEQAQKDYARKSDAIETATFEHGSKFFPMHATARFHYGTMNRTPANYKVLSTTGIVDVPQEQIPAFMNAYYIKINELTRPI